MDTVVVVVIAIVVIVVIIIAGWIIIHKETMMSSCGSASTLLINWYTATPAQMDLMSKRMQGSGIRLIQKTGNIIQSAYLLPFGSNGRSYLMPEHVWNDNSEVAVAMKSYVMAFKRNAHLPTLIIFFTYLGCGVGQSIPVNNQTNNYASAASLGGVHSMMVPYPELRGGCGTFAMFHPTGVLGKYIEVPAGLSSKDMAQWIIKHKV